MRYTRTYLSKQRQCCIRLRCWLMMGMAWLYLASDSHQLCWTVRGSHAVESVLIIVDAHSKFTDARIVSSAITSVTLTTLRQTISFAGLPHTIVSDTGSCFTVEEIEQFCRANGITHVRCSTYHPSSNGASERAVQTVKFGLRKTKGNLDDRL